MKDIEKSRFYRITDQKDQVSLWEFTNNDKWFWLNKHNKWIESNGPWMHKDIDSILKVSKERGGIIEEIDKEEIFLEMI
jgi:hypothetical protein